MKLKIIFFCWILGFLPAVHAWNAMGHAVISDIAYQNLSVKTREKVDQLLIYFNKEYPYIESFTEMSIWPDSIRSQKIEIFTHWHYVDIAFSNDHTPLKNLLNTDNALWALNHIQEGLSNNKANKYERARLLAFFVHVVGDLHQPLHAVSLISKTFPDGDQGGNLYKILAPEKFSRKFYRYNNLHKLWDNGLGFLPLRFDDSEARYLSNNISKEYPESSFKNEALNLKFQDWADEDMKFAAAQVYNTPMNSLPSFEYINNGQEIVKKRLALAGYRLAHYLNKLLEE